MYQALNLYIYILILKCCELLLILSAFMEDKMIIKLNNWIVQIKIILKAVGLPFK